MAQKKTAAPAKKTPAKATKTAAAAKVAKTPKSGAGDSPEIVAIPFDLRVLDGLDERTFDGAIKPPTYFAVQLTAPLAKRFVHVIQKETGKGWVVMMLLGDRDALGKVKRVPATGAWLRAIVDGTVHVLGADVPLLRDEIVKYIGGHEPAPAPTKPPYY